MTDPNSNSSNELYSGASTVDTPAVGNQPIGKNDANQSGSEKSPILDETFQKCQSIGNASYIQHMAYHRIHTTLKRVTNSNWIKSLTVISVRETIQLIFDEYNKLVLSHCELYSLVMSNEARRIQKRFFENATAKYHEANDILMNKYEELSKNDGQQSAGFQPASNQSNQTIELQNLPVSNAEKENWILSREQFVSFINEHNKSDNATKLQQPFKNLRERASSSNKPTPIVYDYERTWSILNDNQTLVNFNLKQCFNMLKESDTSNLSIIANGIKELIKFIPDIKEHMKFWESLLHFCVYNKMNISDKEIWNARHEDRENSAMAKRAQLFEVRINSNAPSASEPTIKKGNVNHLFLNNIASSILGTAEIQVLNTSKTKFKLRCLCDSGSQLNLITKEAAQRLGLIVKNATIQLNGIGGQISDYAIGITNLQICAHYRIKNILEAKFAVVNKITTILPTQPVSFI